MAMVSFILLFALSKYSRGVILSPSPTALTIAYDRSKTSIVIITGKLDRKTDAKCKLYVNYVRNLLFSEII